MRINKHKYSKTVYKMITNTNIQLNTNIRIAKNKSAEILYNSINSNN